MMLTTDIALKVDDELIADEDIAALRARSSPRDCPYPSWHRQARRGERGADPPRAAAELGGQQANRTGQGTAGSRAAQQDFNGSQSGRKKVSLADLIRRAGAGGGFRNNFRAGKNLSRPRPGPTRQDDQSRLSARNSRLRCSDHGGGRASSFGSFLSADRIANLRSGLAAQHRVGPAGCRAEPRAGQPGPGRPRPPQPW